MSDILKVMEQKYDSFSKTNKVLADFSKENLYRIPFMTIGEISDKAGVSLASVTRFTRALGFLGFSDFQKNITQIVQKDVTPMKEMKESIIIDSSESILKTVITTNTLSMSSLYTQELEENFNMAVALIKNCRKLYIVANRSTYSVAYYLDFMLSSFMDNVVLLTGGIGDVSNKLSHVKKEDAVLAMSYARYSKTTFEIANFFQKLGCPSISFTDSYTSPIAMQSNAVCLAKNPSTSYSFVNAFVVASALITALGKENREETLDKLGRHDQIVLDHDIYL